MRSSYHGGQNAREWRREIAALAERKRESVATYKFKLDAHADDFNFDAASRAYGITEGIAQGSLIGLVCAIHLSGFRLFPDGLKTKQFRNRARYPSTAFAEALDKHVGITDPGFTIQSLEKTFSSPPRARDGIPHAWSIEELAKRLFQSWRGRRPGGNNDDEHVFKLAMGIAEVVSAKFDGWKALSEDTAKALACTDEYWASLGSSFPKLAEMSPEYDFQPNNCTFAYDRDALFVDMADNQHIWLHQVVAICARQIQRENPDSNLTSKDINYSITTRSHNGLQWLFGRGLQYLKDCDLRNIAQDLGVPDSDMHRIRQLKQFADAIPDNPFFKTPRYANFRSSVGGKLNSWVSNYWGRVLELNELHAVEQTVAFPDALLKEENSGLFSGQHCDAAALKKLWQRIPEKIGQAGQTLSILKGEGDGIPQSNDISTIEKVAADVETLAGQVAMLENRLDQELENIEQTQNTRSLEPIKRQLEDKTKELKKPNKLNKITGGTSSADEEIQQLESRLNTALKARRKHFQELEHWARSRSTYRDPMEAKIEREHTTLKACRMDQSLAEEQAVRRILHRVSAMSRRLSKNTFQQIRDVIVPLFAKPREANLYFHNRLGSIYCHPRSKTRHDAYGIDIDCARNIARLAWLEDIESELQAELGEPMDKALLRDQLLIEEFLLEYNFDGLPSSVPADLARPKIDDIVRIRPLLAAELDASKVSHSTAKRAFNLFHSAINGLLFQALRDSFIVRVKFQRNDVDELFYVPKNRTWMPPDEYRVAKGNISKGLALPAITRDSAGSILARETVENLSKGNKTLLEPGFKALLRQIPHDWFVELNLRESAEDADRSGLPIKTNGKKIKQWKDSNLPAFRLIGPPSFKAWLDLLLVDEKIKLGDYTLIIDQFYQQSMKVRNGKIALAAEPAKIRAEIAVPVVNAQPYPEAESERLFDNIVAIDLGEKRIGYAVFSLTDMLERGVLDPIVGDNGQPAIGTIAIPAFRKLMSAVRRHRNVKQPNQKVNQTYSKSLMRFRENVIGDICNRIDALCARFRAFPILESEIGNFESGGNQLKMVYGSVLRRYTFSGVDAHRLRRSRHWSTASSWKHPYIQVHQWGQSEKAYSGPSKPLAIFPGYSVHPAGTSQTCHHCRRNAIAALGSMPSRISVEAEGKITLGNGMIRLLDHAEYCQTQRKKYRRRKERLPLNVPVAKGLHAKKKLERIAKRNMRQPPLSEMSPDTSQARFVCVYEDCDFEGHADENAAVNIGRRFLERIDASNSRKSWEALTGGSK